MKVIKDEFEFIMANHIVAVSGFHKIAGSQWGKINYAFAVFTYNGFRFEFLFDTEEHAENCFKKLKSFLRSNNSMEDLFSIEEQPGYVERSSRFLG